MRPALALVLVAGAGAGAGAGACAHSPAGELRFHNRPPVWRVDDRVPLARPPAARDYHRGLYHLDGFVVRRATRVMDVRLPTPARDVNSLGEVPDSTWFENRIGVRALSLDEVRRGPSTSESPFAHLPWTITSAKRGGTAPGFRFRDARGHAYLLKLDARAYPEMETAAHVIVHRILWAAGYHVPEDHLGYVRREDLRIAPGATRKDARGREVPLRAEDVERVLAQAYRAAAGYRAIASRILPGVPLGPFAREGTRRDDPNDLVPHEQRRSLRGQYALFSWLGHSDIQEDQTLDVFVEQPGAPGRGHVVHYLLDFGKALGVMGYQNRWKTVGYTYRLDVGMAIGSLISLGLWRRPWDELEAPGLRGIGLFDAAHYEPDGWRSNSLYWPHEDSDRLDRFWGAKILIRFTRAQLAAIVAEARLSDPAAVRYMVDTLVARQRKAARHWFTEVAPLDRFEVGPGGRLCFDDLWLVHGLGAPGDPPTRYLADAYDGGGAATGYRRQLAAAPGGRACFTGLAPSRSAGGYTIVRLFVSRGARVLPPVRVHLAKDPAGRLRVIGLRRA